jgi:hypothetical protein
MEDRAGVLHDAAKKDSTGEGLEAASRSVTGDRRICDEELTRHTTVLDRRESDSAADVGRKVSSDR